MKQNYPDLIRQLLKHLAIAAPFFALGVLLVARYGRTNVIGALWGLGFMAIGVAIVMVPFAGLLAEPIGGLVYFQGRQSDKPAPIYSMAQALRSAGRYQEALEEYERMTREFPGEVRPYVEMLEIAVVNLKDGTLAESIFQKGMSALEKREEARQKLKARYGDIRSRLEGRTDLPESIVPADQRDRLDAKGRPLR